MSEDTTAEMSPVRVPRAAEPKNILRKYPSACIKVSQPVTMELSEREKKPSAVLRSKKKKKKNSDEYCKSCTFFVVTATSNNRGQKNSTAERREARA